MNRKLNTRATARLYAITCVACIVWLAQSLVEAESDGTIGHWSTIVFALCLLVVIAWTGYNAFTGWNKDDAENDEAGTPSKR